MGDVGEARTRKLDHAPAGVAEARINPKNANRLGHMPSVSVFRVNKILQVSLFVPRTILNIHEGVIMNDSGWEGSAGAWIGHLGPNGDRARRYVLDPAMQIRLQGREFRNALDVGCGEGRICRMLAAYSIQATGIDPTEALITHAKELDKTSDYRIGRAEALPFEDATFDLVISCLSLIDIADYRVAIGEMTRILEPGGTLLVVNLTSFMSAGGGNGWRRDTRGRKSHFGMDEYMHERAYWIEFSGLRIENWHRPLSDYMSAYLGNGLHLTHFDEPRPINAPAEFERHYLRAPFFNLMEWRKPA